MATIQNSSPILDKTNTVVNGVVVRAYRLDTGEMLRETKSGNSSVVSTFTSSSNTPNLTGYTVRNRIGYSPNKSQYNKIRITLAALSNQFYVNKIAIGYASTDLSYGVTTNTTDYTLNAAPVSGLYLGASSFTVPANTAIQLDPITITQKDNRDLIVSFYLESTPSSLSIPTKTLSGSIALGNYVSGDSALSTGSWTGSVSNLAAIGVSSIEYIQENSDGYYTIQTPYVGQVNIFAISPTSDIRDQIHRCNLV